MSILYGTTVSDHIPFTMSIEMDALPALNKNININNIGKLDWSSLTKEEILGYYARTDQSLSNIHIPRDAVICNDVNCSSVEHGNALCSVYDSIAKSLHEGSKHFCKHKQRIPNMRPGWDHHVAMYHDEAREAFKTWVAAGRPRQGLVFEHKKSTTARYKYAVRFICKNEQAMRADSLAKKLSHNNVIGFWKEVKALNNSKTSLPCTMEGISRTDNIADLWRQHYNVLFNDINSDVYRVGSLASNELVGVTPYQVCEAVKKLSNNKASGLDQITAEHFKFASPRIFPLLSICFTGFLTHGILPDSMLSVLLVPVIKDKAGKLCNIDNYRPIALANIVSKVLETILLD